MFTGKPRRGSSRRKVEEGEEDGRRVPWVVWCWALDRMRLGRGRQVGGSQQGLGWEDKGLEDIGEKLYCLSITIQPRLILYFKPRYLNGVSFSSAANFEEKITCFEFPLFNEIHLPNVECLLCTWPPFGYFIPLSCNLELLEMSVSISTLNKRSYLWQETWSLIQWNEARINSVASNRCINP